jgi:hypothetical protein
MIAGDPAERIAGVLRNRRRCAVRITSGRHERGEGPQEQAEAPGRIARVAPPD